MGTVHVTEVTDLAPERVLAAARDFSERRAQLWADVHVEHLTVHGSGDTWADVTEGSLSPVGFTWERSTYDWSLPSSVKATVTDSNVFAPGSTWEIRAQETTDGTVVEVIAVRRLRGKGKLYAPMFRLGMARRMAAQRLRYFLARVEKREASSDRVARA